MNSRRVHRLMLDHFPDYLSTDHEWQVAVDGNGVRIPVIEKLLRENLAWDEKWVMEIDRQRGNCLDSREALPYISEHGANGMRIADRSFRHCRQRRRHGLEN